MSVATETKKNGKHANGVAGAFRIDPAHVPPKEADGREPAGPARRDLASTTLSRVPLHKLVRHPDNRVPTQQAIDDLAASIEERGLLEAPVVRLFGIDGYQIVSGETRVLALRQLGRKGEIDAKVLLHCSDAEALELLAICNAKRTDLGPCEKARLLQRLCAPVADGGAGMTREAAGAIYGLESGGGVSNLLRLLELPDTWQERVDRGELGQSLARELTPYVGIPELLVELEQEWALAHAPPKKHPASDYWKLRQATECFKTREGFAERLGELVREHTREVSRADGVDVRIYTHGVGYNPVYVNVEQHREALQIVTIGESKRAIQLATNVELFDQLQAAALAARKKTKARRASEGADGREPAGETPAALKERRKQQAEQLKKRIAAWRLAWLRRLLAARSETDETIVDRFALWMMTAPFWRADSLHLRDLLGPRLSPRDAGVAVAEFRLETAPRARGTFVRHVLLSDYQDHALPPVIEAFASAAGIDLAAEWRELHDTAEGRESIEEFLELHQADQLRVLAKQWDVFLPKRNVTKAGMVKALAINVSGGLVRPLPKSLEPVAAPKGKRGAR